MICPIHRSGPDHASLDQLADHLYSSHALDQIQAREHALLAASAVILYGIHPFKPRVTKVLDEPEVRTRCSGCQAPGRKDTCATCLKRRVAELEWLLRTR